MRYLTHHSALVLLAALLVAGCSDQQMSAPQTDASSISATNLKTSSVLTINAPDENNGTSASRSARSREETEEQREARSKELVAFLGLAQGDATLEEAHRAIKRKLDEPSSVEQYRREQMAAQAMLRYRLLEDGNDSPLTRKATAFYTNLMLKNRNPNAVVILKALNRLEGHWSEAHIAEAAGTAAQAARTEFAEQANCKSCQTLEDLREVMPGSQISGNTNSAMKATDRLEAISKR